MLPNRISPEWLAAETIAQHITGPKAYVPRNKKASVGLDKPADIKDVIARIETFRKAFRIDPNQALRSIRRPLRSTAMTRQDSCLARA